MFRSTIKINTESVRDYVCEQVANRLVKIGNQCMREARSNGSYTDQTGNLRNSIGYVVMNRGVEVESSNITALNQQTIDQIKARYSQDVVLIVVAGMNYAAYVEAKNYNVLASAELLAKELVKNITVKVD